VHDKTIRRRRAVLALLVVVSLILLTDYFGSPSSSPLHSVQRGIAEVLSPIQDGASKVLSPVRDVGNWFSSTLNAKSKNKKLSAENQKYASEVSRLNYEEALYAQEQKLLKLDQLDNLSIYGLKAANVIGGDSVVWYKTITVNRGSDDGVSEHDPVIGDGGLVGDVTEVYPSASTVTLLTAPQFAVGASVESTPEQKGVLRPAVGSPSTLVLSDISTSAEIATDQEVVTSGFEDKGDPAIRSYFPPGIPIGQVSSQNPGASLDTSGSVQVTPGVDFNQLTVVQILTNPDATT
jgi:rod shape-determining protein MreC